MTIDQKTVETVAHLARLALDPEEVSTQQASLERILSWMETLERLPIEGVEPFIHPTDEVNQLREDMIEPPLPITEVLSNVPLKDSDYIRVPRVVE